MTVAKSETKFFIRFEDGHRALTGRSSLSNIRLASSSSAATTTSAAAPANQPSTSHLRINHLSRKFTHLMREKRKRDEQQQQQQQHQQQTNQDGGGSSRAPPPQASLVSLENCQNLLGMMLENEAMTRLGASGSASAAGAGSTCGANGGFKDNAAAMAYAQRLPPDQRLVDKYNAFMRRLPSLLSPAEVDAQFSQLFEPSSASSSPSSIASSAMINGKKKKILVYLHEYLLHMHEHHSTSTLAERIEYRLKIVGIIYTELQKNYSLGDSYALSKRHMRDMLFNVPKLLNAVESLATVTSKPPSKEKQQQQQQLTQQQALKAKLVSQQQQQQQQQPPQASPTTQPLSTPTNQQPAPAATTPAPAPTPTPTATPAPIPVPQRGKQLSAMQQAAAAALEAREDTDTSSGSVADVSAGNAASCEFPTVETLVSEANLIGEDGRLEPVITDQEFAQNFFELCTDLMNDM